MICSWVNLGFALIVLRPWDTGNAFSKIRQPVTHPSLYFLHPYTKSVQHFKERNKLQIQEDRHEWTRNQEQFDEAKVASSICKKWKSVCYLVVDKWGDILVD